MTNYDTTDPPFVCARVGNAMQVIPFALFLETFEALADHFRDQGLTGDDLDNAISEVLPTRLDQVVNGVGVVKH